MTDQQQPTTTQAVYTKQGLGAVNVGSSASATTPLMASAGTSSGMTPPAKKRNSKSLAAMIGGIALLVVLILGGALVYRFSQTEQVIVPTQTNAGSCSLTFTVAGEEGPISCIQAAVNETFAATTIPAYFQKLGVRGQHTYGNGATFALAGNIGEMTGVITKKKIAGDFTTQTTISSFTKPAGISSSAELRLQSNTTSSKTTIFLAVRWQTQNGVVSKIITANKVVSDEGVSTGTLFIIPVAQESEDISLKHVKTGTKVESSYKIGSGQWQLLATYLDGLDMNFQIDIGIGSFDTQPVTLAVFKNFIISCGENPIVSLQCTKRAYRDEFSNTVNSYNLQQLKTSFQPGDIVVYYVETKTTGASSPLQIDLSDTLNQYLTFVDSSCGANAFNSTTKVLTCIATTTADPTTSAVTFRAKISDTTPNGTIIKNTASISANKSAAGVTIGSIAPKTCEVDITVAATSVTYSCNSDCTSDTQCKTSNANYICSSNKCRLSSNTTSTTCQPTNVSYSCNSSCDTDEQCRGVNASYVCENTDSGKKCRLDNNRTSLSCTPVANSYSCNSACTTDAQCQTANSNYLCNGGNCRQKDYLSQTNCQAPNQPTPTPTIGCNQTCGTNADCSNPNHICYETDGTKKCRLADYVNSSSCTTPGTTSVPAPITTNPAPQPAQPSQPGQPQQPTSLPQAGAGDLVKVLGAGAGALVLGGLFILLLL